MTSRVIDLRRRASKLRFYRPSWIFKNARREVDYVKTKYIVKQNITYSLVDMNFTFTCSTRYLTREISSWPLEDKFHIHARACNILYIFSNWLNSLLSNSIDLKKVIFLCQFFRQWKSVLQTARESHAKQPDNVFKMKVALHSELSIPANLKWS